MVGNPAIGYLQILDESWKSWKILDAHCLGIHKENGCPWAGINRHKIENERVLPEKRA
jgi:hypothetical protein